MKKFKSSFFHQFDLIFELIYKYLNDLSADFQLKINLFHFCKALFKDTRLIAFYYLNYDLSNEMVDFVEKLLSIHFKYISKDPPEGVNKIMKEKLTCKWIFIVF